ncbi:MAG: TatD family hydrolase [Muribaculaceae bacterium]|nr:TatD family hydrolase [Muribaculaceae bacterium]MDE6028674.1 TatD family hydrolase [Muribaculaceae bacterium]
MTDTHTHLYMGDFEDGGAKAVERAINAGVGMMIFPCVDSSSIEPMTALHHRFPENTRIGIGLHPTELGEDWEATLDSMERDLEGNPEIYSAIGETGIDLYWDATNAEAQKKAFARQYEWASLYNLPLIIHCREGLDEVLEAISSFDGSKRPEMIFHSFTYGPEEVRKIREICDPWFGINGVATFKNAANVREAVKEIGIDRIVLETDSPYLAPVPFRGKQNESAYIISVCRKVGEVLGLSSEDVERLTDANAKKIFKL